MLSDSMEEPGKQNEKITHLVNTALWVNQSRYTIDLTQLPLADLLVPERNLPQSVILTIKKIKDLKIEILDKKLEKALPPLEQRSIEQKHFVEQLRKCAETMSDIRYIIPFFVDLGREIQRQVTKAGDCIPPLHQNRAAYQLYIAAIPCPAKRVDRSKAHIITAPVLDQMDYKTPFIKGNQKTFPAPRKVMTQALTKLAMQDLQPDKAPTFIGYIEPEYAIEWACHHGFSESNASLVFAHGNFPHLIALTYLSRKAGLNSEGLRQIIEYGVWSSLLDMNGVIVTSAYALTESPHRIFMVGFHRAILMDNPNIIQNSLLLARISEALKTILAYPDIEDHLAELSHYMKEPITTKQQLQNMIEPVQALENYVTQFELSERMDIINGFPESVADNQLYYGKLGCFTFDENTVITIRKEAKKLFEQDETFLTGYIQHPDNTWTPCAIQSLSDIERCKTFVACDKKPEALPPHAKSLHANSFHTPKPRSSSAGLCLLF